MMWFKTSWFIGVSSIWVIGASLTAPFPLLKDIQKTNTGDTTSQLTAEIKASEKKQLPSIPSHIPGQSETSPTIAFLSPGVMDGNIKSLLPPRHQVSETIPIEAERENAREDKKNPTQELPSAQSGQGVNMPVRIDIPRIRLQEDSKSADRDTSLLVFPLGGIQEQNGVEKTPAPEISTQNERTLNQEKRTAKKEPIVGTANRIVVPSIEIDIAVQPGSYDPATSEWTVDESTAFHADITVPVNDSNGTTLIYGHARWGLFGNLPDISEGAEATVYTSEGKQFVYTFESVREVSPTDVTMLTAEGAPKLIMQTCSGLFNQHRIIATFQLKNVV